MASLLDNSDAVNFRSNVQWNVMKGMRACGPKCRLIDALRIYQGVGLVIVPHQSNVIQQFIPSGLLILIQYLKY